MIIENRQPLLSLLYRCETLEKENAGLKEKLEIEQNARGDWFGKAVTKDRRLSEAKEIITALLNVFVYDLAEEELDSGQVDVRVKAEQFLKDDEIEK